LAAPDPADEDLSLLADVPESFEGADEAPESFEEPDEAPESADDELDAAGNVEPAPLRLSVR
jgi:hypothetical protein